MTWEEKDKAYIWHPFTQTKTALPPVHIERAEGCWLHATDGRKILDVISSWWVNIHGHANPVIAKAIAEQAANMEQVIFAGFTHTPAITLAETLLGMLPAHFSKVFYSDNGSTAVEVALKMALQYWHNKGDTSRTKIIAFENAYHGDTFGAMSAGARSAFNAAFNRLLFDVIHIPAPTENNCEEVCRQLETLAAEDNVAAFIFEPLVQGSGGMLMHQAAHLDRLLAVAGKHGILCIADEVMTGFGRTGTLFACEQLRETADIICLSKGITGGFLPLGVTSCTAEIYDAFYSDDRYKTLFHGHSYTANPIACAAAIASTTLLLSPECKAQVAAICEQHRHFAQTLRHDMIRDIRQTGTILAIEFKTEEGSSYFSSMRDSIYEFALEHNILLRPLGNIVYLMPPYCITADELQSAYAVIEKLPAFLARKSYI